MRRPPRPFVMSALICSAVLIFQAPLRHQTLSLLRFPFMVTRSLVTSLLTLPQLPSLVRDNEQLRTELVQRQLEVAQLRETLRHSQQAQALLKRTPSSHGIVAQVIGRSTLPMQQTILLNKGAHDGLTLESVVIDAFGVVGHVTELHATTCLVVLLTDPESRVAGLIERSRETGLLVGQGVGQCQLMYVGAQADLEEGDRLVTAGLGGSFPKGLPLGTVGQITRAEVSGTAWAWVSPAARLSQLEEVLCLTSSSRPEEGG